MNTGTSDGVDSDRPRRRILAMRFSRMENQDRRFPAAALNPEMGGQLDGIQVLTRSLKVKSTRRKNDFGDLAIRCGLNSASK